MMGVALGACNSTPETDSAGDDTQTGDTQTGDTQTGDTHTGDTQDYSAQFAEGALPESIRVAS